ncbi:hypothetical protein [Halarchaeum grantii]|nr:hypothetical protein [Halarchaeum grantii]
MDVTDHMTAAIRDVMGGAAGGLVATWVLRYQSGIVIAVSGVILVSLVFVLYVVVGWIYSSPETAGDDRADAGEERSTYDPPRRAS